MQQQLESVQEALSIFKIILQNAEINLSKPSPIEVWQVFKRFAQIPFNCPEEDLLFQYGTFNFTEKNLFYCDFVRQFTFEVDGEYDHMEQLHCELTCQPTQKLKYLEGNLWADEFNSLQEFFQKIENEKFFQEIASYSEWIIKVYQEKV